MRLPSLRETKYVCQSGTAPSGVNPPPLQAGLPSPVAATFLHCSTKQSCSSISKYFWDPSWVPGLVLGYSQPLSNPAGCRALSWGQETNSRHSPISWDHLTPTMGQQPNLGYSPRLAPPWSLLLPQAPSTLALPQSPWACRTKCFLLRPSALLCHWLGVPFWVSSESPVPAGQSPGCIGAWKGFRAGR